MLTKPIDFARCRGRTWSDDEFLADECIECERFVSHHALALDDPAVWRVEPTSEQPCSRRVQCAADTPTVRANRPVEAEGRNGSELSE